MRIIKKSETTAKQFVLSRMASTLVVLVLLGVALSAWLAGCGLNPSTTAPIATQVPTLVSNAIGDVAPTAPLPLPSDVAPTAPLPLPSDVAPTAPLPLSVVTKTQQIATTHPINFTSLAQGDSYTANLETPVLSVAGSPAEATHLAELLGDDDLTRRIQEVDFNTSLIVAVFSGKMGSSGHSVTIQTIDVTAGKVQVRVNLTDPAPGQNVSDVISYPYHIIQIPKEQVPMAPNTIWTLYSADNTLLIETKYP